MKATESPKSEAKLALRFYGIVCATLGLISIGVLFRINPGAHGIADWTKPWPVFALLALLGVAVFFLLRWFVLVFSILSTAFGLYFACVTVAHVPFPWELTNLFVASLLIAPSFLTYRAWHTLR